VEVTQQLRGQAGPNQVKDPCLGMAQNIGGSGATAITHILEAMGAYRSWGRVGTTAKMRYPFGNIVQGPERSFLADAMPNR